MRIKHEYAAAISGGGNGSAAEVGQTFTIDKVRKLGGFYMSSGSYLLDENLVIGTTYKITGVGDTYWDIEPVIKDEDSSLPDQSKWLKVYYFNLFSGYDNATQDKFKAGSSYLVVKVEGPHSWLVEQSDVVKVAPCPVCGEALNSAGECSINNCRWIKDEPSTLKANQYRVHCRCNYPVKTGLEPLAIGNIVHYHCTDQDGHYWLKEGLASLKLPLGKELDSSKIFKIVTIDNDDYWTIEELESVPGMVEVFHDGKIVGDSYKVSHNKDYPSEVIAQEVSMKIYTGGVVVRKRTVVAGEGVSQGKEITEVVFSTSQGFAAANDETARMKVLSAAIAAKAITDTDIDSQIAPLTVELSAPNVTR